MNPEHAKVGDRVTVETFEGVSGPAIVIEIRPTPGARCRVLMDDGNPPPFWAHDFELRDPEPRVGYDSRPETLAHIEEVRSRLGRVADDLRRRAAAHDLSKLLSPEREAFDESTPKLRGLTYGSEEYRAALREIRPAVEHHYRANGHHPEFYPDGISGMGLADLIEMLCDWKAATLRHADGDIRRSVEVNQARFGYSDELKSILLNTLPLIESPAGSREGRG